MKNIVLIIVYCKGFLISMDIIYYMENTYLLEKSEFVLNT